MERVSLVKCENYDLETAVKAVSLCFEELGGIGNFVKKGQKVLIKANLLNNFKIDTATTTHPSVIYAIAKLLIEYGCEVTIGDSSGGLYNKSHMSSVYKVTGMEEVSIKTGAKLNDNFSSTTVNFDKGVASKRFDIIDCALSCDVIINAAKLKTHQLTFYTGCVKNLFGLIPGLQKVQMHAESPNLIKFLNFLIDVNEYIKDKVVINFIDACVAMEGNGPSAGKPKEVKRLVASRSPYAADLVGMTLMNGKVENFPQTFVCKQRGISPTMLNEIEVVGEDLEKSKVVGFKLVKDDHSWENKTSLPKGLGKPLITLISPYPYVNKRKCKGCRKCFDHCPNKAITMVDNKATFDLNKCIRCYCCQELCPYHLIKVKRSFVSRLIKKEK